MGMGMGFAMGQKMAEALATTGDRGAPPPLPTSGSKYFLGIGGQRVGPLDMSGLRAEIQAGRLSRSTLVWKEGMSGWTPAEKVPELQTLLPPGEPPPLPA